METLWTFGVSIIITVLQIAVKNEATKKRIRTRALQIRDAIELIWPDAPVDAAKARKALGLKKVA